MELGGLHGNSLCPVEAPSPARLSGNSLEQASLHLHFAKCVAGAGDRAGADRQVRTWSRYRGHAGWGARGAGGAWGTGWEGK